MNILIIPKIIEPYKNQLEFSIETKLLSFLKKCFNNCNINISYNFKFNKKYNLIILSGGNTVIQFSKKKMISLEINLMNIFSKKQILIKFQLLVFVMVGISWL